MTEELHNYLDFEFPNKLDKGEEEADKLNELTFNSELPWEFDDVGFDNDNTLKTFEFDSHDVNDGINMKLDYGLKNRNDHISDDLLGLTGSLINFGIFKTHPNNDDKEESLETIFKDSEFQIAFNKLDLVDKSSVCGEEHNLAITMSKPDDEVSQKAPDLPLPVVNVSLESPFIQLTKFSELLHDQFQQYQKADTNLHVLNQIVSNHLNLLSKQLQMLNLTMDILPQLRYFRILMSFVAIDNKLTEIQAKYANNSVQMNNEISQIIHHFSIQPRPQQMELCLTHPFYHNLMNMLVAQNAAQSPGHSHKPFPSPTAALGHDNNSLPEWASNEDKKSQENYDTRCRNFSQNEGGWMSDSEREWLIKIQTRNLVTDNPYVHDYYYTKMKLRELTEARKLQILQTGHTTISDPITLLPSPITGEQLEAGIDPNKDGILPGLKPIHFEKSLGMLSPSNLNTPRQIIQLSQSHRHGLLQQSVSATASPTTTDGGSKSHRAARSQRELLGLIEKIYSIVLRIDEVDKSLRRMLVEQHRSRGVLVQHRNYLLKLLIDCVTNNTKFVDLLSVSKGARVLVSTIAIVKSAQFVQVLRTIFFNCISVCESQFFPEIESELRSIVCSRVRNLSPDELSLLLTTFYCNVTPNSLTDSQLRMLPLSGFCSNEFGLYIILTVLDAFLKSNPADKAHVTQLLSITIKSTESQSLLLKSMKDFKFLFPSTDHRH